MNAVKLAIERKRQQAAAAAVAAGSNPPPAAGPRPAAPASIPSSTPGNVNNAAAESKARAAEATAGASGSGENGDEQESKRVKTVPTVVRDPLGTVHLVPPSVVQTPEDEVHSWIARTLHEWRIVLEARTEKEKLSAMGRQNSLTFKQSAESLQPLVRLLEKRTLRQDILDNLLGIVTHCEERNYRAAMDKYIRITIGNSPWPIGATKTGIHARAGDDKIAEDKQDSVMKNEVSKNYMMAVKRLMTHAQHQRPAAMASLGF